MFQKPIHQTIVLPNFHRLQYFPKVEQISKSQGCLLNEDLGSELLVIIRLEGQQ